MSRPSGFRWPYRPTTPYRNKQTGALRVVAYMDDDTYAELDRMARANNCSLSSQVTLAIEVGLEELAAPESIP